MTSPLLRLGGKIEQLALHSLLPGASRNVRPTSAHVRGEEERSEVDILIGILNEVLRVRGRHRMTGKRLETHLVTCIHVRRSSYTRRTRLVPPRSQAVITGLRERALT